MKISLVILTFNRAEIVRQAMSHNFKNAGRQIDELVWVDNGSTDNVRKYMKELQPDVSVLHSENLGVAKGYNRGYALASGDYVCITGCDRLMPDGWLATYAKYLEAIPNTGIISIFSQPLEKVPERVRGLPYLIDGLPMVDCLPFGSRILPRKLLTEKIGFLREDFGLYGWEDVEWGERALKVLKENHLLSYTIPGVFAEHKGNEGIKALNGSEDPAYHAFKQQEARDPRKIEVLQKARAEGHPYYNPFYGQAN